EGLAHSLFDTNCIEILEASFSSDQSVATFDNNGGNFPLDDGITIRSGKAIYSEGPYTGNHLSSQENDLSDPDLEDIINASGQELEVTDVAFFQFDFVSPFNNLSFNFIF